MIMIGRDNLPQKGLLMLIMPKGQGVRCRILKFHLFSVMHSFGIDFNHFCPLLWLTREGTLDSALVCLHYVDRPGVNLKFPKSRPATRWQIALVLQSNTKSTSSEHQWWTLYWSATPEHLGRELKREQCKNRSDCCSLRQLTQN